VNSYLCFFFPGLFSAIGSFLLCPGKWFSR